MVGPPEDTGKRAVAAGQAISRLRSFLQTDAGFDPRLNRDAVTRAFGSKDDALRAACDLVARKCIVHSVQGTDNDKLDAVAIMKWCKGHRTALKPPVPN